MVAPTPIQVQFIGYIKLVCQILIDKSKHLKFMTEICYPFKYHVFCTL